MIQRCAKNKEKNKNHAIHKIAEMIPVIDWFHVKNHTSKACRTRYAAGSMQLCCCRMHSQRFACIRICRYDPKQHLPAIAEQNFEACEQTFRWLARKKWVTRHMCREVFFLYMVSKPARCFSRLPPRATPTSAHAHACSVVLLAVARSQG